jgi:predicted nucleic acid-binding protein
MKIYLDVSCLNRPFDDQRQERIRLESEAVLMVLARVAAGEWVQVSSAMAVDEINATLDLERRDKALQMLAAASAIIEVTDAVLARAEQLKRLGVHLADAVHVAAAEAQHADVFLTCDDRLLRLARRQARVLKVRVCDPVSLMRQQ